MLAGCAASSGSQRGNAAGTRPTAPEPPAVNGTPLGLQMAATSAQMKQYPFRTLAPFEHAVDLAFLRVDGPVPAIDPEREHTGGSSLLLKPGTRGVSVRLSSLLSGVTWPGQWTLMGAYVHCAQAQRLRASYEIEGISMVDYDLEVPAGQWTPVVLDISTLTGEAARRIGSLRLTFPAGTAQPVWMDDVVLINNERGIVTDGNEQPSPSAWRISERGFNFTIERRGGFRELLPMAQSTAGGWSLAEANELRARFTSKGPVKQRVMYSDGRQYIDGRYEPLGGRIEAVDRGIDRQHAQPAEVQVRTPGARVNRTHPGDANNDGYAELRGAYQLIGSGARLEFVLLPRDQTPVMTPVVEIAGLPQGEVFAQADGTLIERVARLENGDVLLQLPGRIDRTVTVNVRIRQ